MKKKEETPLVKYLWVVEALKLWLEFRECEVFNNITYIPQPTIYRMIEELEKLWDRVEK